MNEGDEKREMNRRDETSGDDDDGTIEDADKIQNNTYAKQEPEGTTRLRSQQHIYL